MKKVAPFLLFYSLLFSSEIFSPPKPFKVWSDKSLQNLLDLELKGEKTAELEYNIAQAYIREKNYSGAKEYFRKALELEPDNSFLFGEYGKLYLLVGDRDSAKMMFEKSLELNYENMPIWEELVKLDPNYYFNLGMLYGEKAKLHSSSQLARQSVEYLKMYEEKVKDGPFVSLSRTTRTELELFVKDLEARERKIQYEEQQKAIAREKAETIKSAQTTFRKGAPYYAGVGFRSFQPFHIFTFYAKNPLSVVDDSVSIKQPISELSIFFGRFEGPFFLRGFLSYGSSTTDKSFLQSYNQNLTPPRPIYGNLREINSLRVGAEVLYNPFFRPPVLILAGPCADFARFTPVDRDNTFKSISGYEIGWSAYAMFYSRNFTFDIGYCVGIVGSRSGGNLIMGIGYKF